MRKHGVTVRKNNKSLDFLMVKFDYGVEADRSEKVHKPPIKAQELRDYYYEQGITISWPTYDKETGKIISGNKAISYQMLMRSPGKAKEGHCVFIRKDLHKKAIDFLTMRLWNKMENKIGAKIVEMSAYAPLVTATAIDYISIPLKNIFVVKDENVSVNKKAYTVKTHDVVYRKMVKDFPAFENYINQFNYTFYKKKLNKNPNIVLIDKSKAALKACGIDVDLCPEKETTYIKNECYVDRDNQLKIITNTLWDGMGLIDESIFPKNMEGFIYCRSHFFKSCLFKGNIQEYFKDYYGDKYNETYVTDMLRRTIKVSDIKIIVTENSLKWMKFFDLMSKEKTPEAAFKYYEKFMKEYGERFAIVKSAHKSKYGDLQRSSFQINNTLLTTDRDILKKIASTSIKYCNRLKTDDSAFLEYLKITGTARYSINNVLVELYQLNDNFRYTEYFKNKRTRIISNLKNKRLRLGKLLQYGDNLTICGNPIAMLMKVTGQDFLNEGCFSPIDYGIQCYTSRFQEGEGIAGFRSPHNSQNNIVYLENVYPDKLIKYFPDLGDNVIVINGLGTDIQSRLNGQDLDSDFIFATNQKETTELAKRAYREYPTIVNGIEPTGTSEYDKSMLSYSKMDSNIASSQYAIGYASNIAQLALSYYFDEGCKNKNLEDVFIICSVLAQIAIDSAKRNFNIKVNTELARIKNLSIMKRKQKYPEFYAKVQYENNKRKDGKKLKIKEDEVRHYNCPMDIIYEIIDQNVLNLSEHKELNTETIVGTRVFFEYKADHIKVDRKQYQKVVSIIKEYINNIEKLDHTKESYHEERLTEFEVCMGHLKNLTIKGDTLRSLIAYALHPDNGYLRDNLLVVLYDKDKTAFLNCFKKSTKSPQKTPLHVDL